jgi:hypothetical protein
LSERARSDPASAYAQPARSSSRRSASPWAATASAVSPADHDGSLNVHDSTGHDRSRPACRAAIRAASAATGLPVLGIGLRDGATGLPVGFRPRFRPRSRRECGTTGLAVQRPRRGGRSRGLAVQPARADTRPRAATPPSAAGPPTAHQHRRWDTCRAPDRAWRRGGAELESASAQHAGGHG